MFASEVDGAVQNPQVVWLVGHVAVLLHVQLHAGPIGVDLAVLLDEDIVQNVVGDAVVASLHDGGIGKGLVVGSPEWSRCSRSGTGWGCGRVGSAPRNPSASGRGSSYTARS